MRTAERTLADLLHLRMTALPSTERLADFELIRAPEQRRPLPLTASGSDCGA